MYIEPNETTSPIFGPLNYVASIGLPDHIGIDLVLLEDAIGSVGRDRQHLFGILDRSEAMRRAQRLRLMGGSNLDVDFCMHAFVHEVIEAKEGQPGRLPFYSPRDAIKPLTRQELVDRV
jgi:hypothetical protein